MRICQNDLVTRRCRYAIDFQHQNALVAFGLGENAPEIFFGFGAVKKLMQHVMSESRSGRIFKKEDQVVHRAYQRIQRTGQTRLGDDKHG